MFILRDSALLLLFQFIFKAKYTSAVPWKNLKCSLDGDNVVPEGKVPDIGRFPWMGIVQHSFMLGGKMRFAITSGILIHHGYAIAVAEDIAKILPEQIQNNTKFIAWKGPTEKYAMDVHDYVLHPDYLEQKTYATIALLELEPWVTAKVVVNRDIEKEVYKVDYVEDIDCQEFYDRASLNYNKMRPARSICTVVKNASSPCIWDAGVALITRQNWGFWVLLGFGVRGPGCGAPARFINMHSLMEWIDETITRKPIEDYEDRTSFVLRQFSPYELIMYKADVILPRDQGQCRTKKRGRVIYKDIAELLVSKNFGQGFYFLEVHDLAQFNCMRVQMEVVTRSNAAVWLEHQCHRDITGLSPGMQGPDYRKSSNPFESDFESLDSKKKSSKSASSKPKPKPKPKKPAAALAPAFHDIFGASGGESDSEAETVPTPKKKKRSRVFPDSEDEEEAHGGTIRAAPLQSTLSRRTGTSYTVQRNLTRRGEFYIECRVYNSGDIENLSAEDFKSHWKRAFTTFKCAFNKNSPTFKAVGNLIAAAKEEFRSSQPVEYPTQMF